MKIAGREKMMYAFGDVSIEPGDSDVLLSEISVKSKLTTGIPLFYPIVSAPMDTVTGARTARAMARAGGFGIIHKNMTIAEQTKKVINVKRSQSGMIITSPITISPYATILQLKKQMKKFNISAFPVLTKQNELLGIITSRDIMFARNNDLNKQVRSYMTKREDLVTVGECITISEAESLMHRHRKEKLIVLNEEGKLAGLITYKDLDWNERHSHATKDSKGRLMVGAAVGTGPTEKDMLSRVEALVKAEVDLICVDSSHGQHKIVEKAVAAIHGCYSDMEILAGNVATPKGAEDLIRAGATGIRGGVGGGSICATRLVTGIGVSQLTAAEEMAEHCQKVGIPLCADGAIEHSGDLTKLFAVGALSVMCGSVFAGCDETPGEIIYFKDRRFKIYRGMGSLEALKEDKERYYFNDDSISDDEPIIPEGIVSRVPYSGPIEDRVKLFIGGLLKGMQHVGARNLKELSDKAIFRIGTPNTANEAYHHGVELIRSSPNYPVK